MKPRTSGSDEVLDAVQRAAFAYFRLEYRAGTALIPDNTAPDAACSVACLGYALAVLPVAATRELIAAEEARSRCLAILRRVVELPQSDARDAAGYHGFYYHFLAMESGRRAGDGVSTIDTAILIAGAMMAADFYAGEAAEEVEIRRLARHLADQADWVWALNHGQTVAHGWRPEAGFLENRWDGGYSEGLLLYILGLGSQTYPLPEHAYAAFCADYEWRTAYGLSYVYAGPLFIHQLPHVFLDLREIQDAYMREHSLDYFENSRRATYIQREYAKHNPQHLAGYGEDVWGVTACEGPGLADRSVAGSKRRFWGYHARGVPFGPDDGTIAPWAAAASLPFAPEIVFRSIEKLDELELHETERYGFAASFNPSFRVGKHRRPWHSEHQYGINQALVLLLVENFRTGRLWRAARRQPDLVRGLTRAGFRGGWLDGKAPMLA